MGNNNIQKYSGNCNQELNHALPNSGKETAKTEYKDDWLEKHDSFKGIIPKFQT